MTKEKLLARKAEAEKHKEELVADVQKAQSMMQQLATRVQEQLLPQVHVAQGMIEECNYWLSEMGGDAPPAPPKPQG